MMQRNDRQRNDFAAERPERVTERTFGNHYVHYAAHIDSWLTINYLKFPIHACVEAFNDAFHELWIELQFAHA